MLFHSQKRHKILVVIIVILELFLTRAQNESLNTEAVPLEEFYEEIVVKGFRKLTRIYLQ